MVLISGGSAPKKWTQKDYDKLHSEYISIIYKKIIKKYGLKIIRIGYVTRCIIDDRSIIKNILQMTSKNILNDVSDLVIRFSKLYPSQSGATIKDVSDYQNIIITITKGKEKEGRRSIINYQTDFQQYFKPSLGKSTENDIRKLIRESRSKNIKIYNERILTLVDENSHE